MNEKPYIIDGERVTREEYRKTRCEDLRVRVPVGAKEKIREAAKKAGVSVNEYVGRAIAEAMARDQQA